MGKVKVGVLGATGYAGVELVRLLRYHPEVDLVYAGSESYAGTPISKVYPHLDCDLVLQPQDHSAAAGLCDVVFTALPHGLTMGWMKDFDLGQTVLIDLGADFRLKSAEVFEKWYGTTHSAPWLLEEAVYGLSEVYRSEIREARLVANPGCYPTSILLPLHPLLARGLIEHGTIIADSKSGVSGAGRSAKTASLFAEVNEDFKAYGVGGKHRHLPEIEQELGRFAGRDVTISFTPHLLPITRGIMSTIYADLAPGTAPGDIAEALSEAYGAESFVRIRSGELPRVKEVAGTNRCDIGFVVDERTNRLVLVSVIDNLLKGAAGQAVQNMNLILGLDETTGLPLVSNWP